MKAITLLAALAVIAASTVAGEALPSETPPRIAATAIPAASAMRVDGDLTEEVWQRAPVITGFKQRDPRDGAPATFEAEARVAYDDNAIYIAVGDRLGGRKDHRPTNAA